MHLLLTLATITGGIVAAVHAQTPTCVATNPPPSPTAICGLRGTNTNPYWKISNPGVATSLEDCAGICNGRRINAKQGQTRAQYWCRSFYWDSVNNRCGLGQEDVNKSITANASSTQVYYSYRCFNCGAFCDQPSGQQLLVNGGFEQSPLGPWLTEGGTGPGFNSAASWEVTPNTFTYVQQRWNHCNGYVYKFSFDYKVTPSGNKPPIFSVYFDTWAFRDTSLTGTAGQWKAVTGFQSVGIVTFDAGDNTDQIHGASNTYNVDNVVVTHFDLSTANTQPLAQPAFQNAGFESGHLSPWNFTVLSHAPSSIISPGLGGSDYALFIDLSQKGTKDTEFYLSQTMQTKPNTNYMLSFDYHVQGKRPVANPGGKSPALDLSLIYGSDTVNVDVNNYEPFGLYFGQNTFKYPIGVQAASTPFTFSMGLSGYWAGGNVTFDNFLLEEIID